MVRPLGALLLAFGLCAPVGATDTRAAELVMFDAEFCEWCDAWDKEVGVVYHKTEEACLAPLRRVRLHDPRPDDLDHIVGVVYTPTFVLVDDGRELGRITGYPGDDHFWGLLGVLLKKLPSRNQVC